jgi:hypothetical protein
VAGAVIAAGAAVYYLRDIIARNSKPHRVTWAVWTCIGVLGFGTAHSAGAGPGAYVAAVYVVGAAVTFLLSLSERYGKAGVSRRDEVLGVLAVGGIVMWRFGGLGNSAAAAVAVLCDAAALWPTVREAWRQPFTEALPAWVADAVAACCGVIALERYTLAAVAYPVYLFIGTGVVVAVLGISRRRSQATG